MASKAFVTGGTGFLGSNLVRLLLQEGYTVRVLVRPSSCLDNLRGLNLEIIKGDIHDPGLATQMQGCDVLFHLAACYSLWRRDRVAVYRHNVEGTRLVLRAARRAGIARTVYTSSVAAIGTTGSDRLADETWQSPLADLVGHYKKSKFLAEQEAQKAVQLGQDVVIVNPSTPIGPGDLKPTPTGEILMRFLQGNMPVCVDTGLNFIDVRDVARGHLLALERGKIGDRYILGHQNLTLQTLLEQLAEITGKKAPRLTIPVWLPVGIAWVDEVVLAPWGKTPAIPLEGTLMSSQKMYYDASKAVRELGLPQSAIAGACRTQWTGFAIISKDEPWRFGKP
ncbi:MAG: NAD-dependent epimerase/dehydratase family protein [Chloroflexaceae bacterium]|nr:NAD-dependent epimerase/dehydratase family protein [Chloroflexaceae bacterium]